MNLVLTLWRNFSKGRREEHTWKSFVDTFVAQPETVRYKKSVAGFSLASFKNDYRTLPGVERVHGLVLDFDHGDPTVKKITKAVRAQGIAYTTWSHEPNAPRLRAAFPLSRPVNAAEHERVWLWAADRCKKVELEADPRARDASHLFFLPSHRPGAEFWFKELAGAPLDVEQVLLEAKDLTPSRVVPCTDPSSPGNNTGGGAVDLSPSGLDFRFVLECIRRGASDAEITKALRKQSKKGMRPDYVERTIMKARAVHEVHAPVMSVSKAAFRALDARFGHPERRHVELKLRSEDGEIAETKIIVPAPWYPNVEEVWVACFPDVDPAPLLGPWEGVRPVWESIRWKERRFEVAVRGGEVRWMRAASG